MSALTALSGGVVGTAAAEFSEDEAQLRQLIDDLGRRSFDSRAGRHGPPERFDNALWRGLEDTGLARLTTTADLGATPVEAAVVLSGLARHAAAVPIAETDLLAAWLAQRAGFDVPETGPLTVGLATADGDAATICGTATNVPWARAASVLVVTQTEGGLYAGAVDDLDLIDAHNVAGEPRETIRFQTPIQDLSRIDDATYAELQRRGAWARCVQGVGALDAIAALTLAHARERKQFGRPLSAFQAVQHALATMAGHIERARAAATLAIAAAADNGFDSPRTDYAVSVAKVVLGRVGTEVSTIAHQLHGAIGSTAEHPLWLYTMRLRSWTDEFGGTAQHAQRVGRAALSRPDAWDFITGQFD